MLPSRFGNGIPGHTTRASPYARGGRVRTGDLTTASTSPWPQGHDDPYISIASTSISKVKIFNIWYLWSRARYTKCASISKKPSKLKASMSKKPSVLKASISKKPLISGVARFNMVSLAPGTLKFNSSILKLRIRPSILKFYSISFVFKEIIYRVKTFDIKDLLYRVTVRYIHYQVFDIEGQDPLYQEVESLREITIFFQTFFQSLWTISKVWKSLEKLEKSLEKLFQTLFARNYYFNAII